jgi:hypothetical protein
METAAETASFRTFLAGMALFVCLLFGLAWIWVTTAPTSYIDPDYSVWRAKETLLQQDTAQVLILGDSCAEDDLIPDRLGPDVINLGGAGTTPIDAYFLAKKIVALKPLPRAVIISFVPFHFANPTPELFWSRMTFGSLGFGDLNEIRETSRRLHDNVLFGTESPGDIDARLKIALLSVKLPSFNGPALLQALFEQRMKENSAAYAAVLQSRGQKYRDVHPESDRLDETSSLKVFVPSKLIDFYFDQTLALLSSQRIPTYFIGMPHRELSDKLYTRTLRDNYAAYLQSYARLYPDFHILGDPLPNYPMADFGDYAHLNAQGAARWSDHVARALREAGIEPGPKSAP